jgi:hypothetical protein
MMMMMISISPQTFLISNSKEGERKSLFLAQQPPSGPGPPHSRGF